MARTNWSNGEEVDATVMNNLGEEINRPRESLVVETLSVAYANAEHTVINMMRGFYTPQSDTILVDVGYSGKLEGAAHMTNFFAWNQGVAEGTDLLTGRGFLSGSYIAGTEYRTLGATSSPGNTGNARRQLVITGLTPGQPMVWQVDVGATGYMETLYPGDYPLQIARTPNDRVLLVSAYTTNSVKKFDMGNRWSVDGVTREIDQFTVNTVYGIATHPTDNSIFYAASNGAGEVYEMSVEDGSILRTFAVTTPYHLAVSRDGTKLYVGNGGTSITPVTLADGTVGASITVGGYGGASVFRAVGDYIMVPATTGQQVNRITVADDSVTTLAMPTAGQEPRGLDAAADDESTFWVTTRTPNEAFEVATETMQLTAAPRIPDAAIDGVPISIAASPTGKSVIIATGSRILQTFVLPPKGVFYEEAVGQGSFIDTDRFGDLWILNQNGNEMYHFHAARLDIDPSDDFWSGYADVSIQSL